MAKTADSRNSISLAREFSDWSSLKQAPILFITGRAKLSLTGDEIRDQKIRTPKTDD